ncbi:MAG: hypothetical protein Q9M94_01330 [Candidatus Gracilibacteria bacterium]|nr:hypothetical protein [Candidatus Gracilibacteria bacterium]MDQ7023255.1 hypothetical protein [Candidatus Gracilibacteria bacterium]
MVNFKKITLTLSSLYYLILSSSATFATGKGLLEGVGGSVENIRTGNLHIDDIAGVIKGMIDIFLGLAGTISVIFVIIGAYYFLFGSIKGDISKGKDTITMALTGFAITVLSWFIVKLIFDNFG